MTYDSALEADWAATFTAWGMDFRYHPGRLFLSNNDVWEPDFQLEDDIIFEVKGEHNYRLDKAHRAHTETGIPVIVGRSGWIPAGSDIEYAGAVWEPEEWLLVHDGVKLAWTKDERQSGHYSAILAYALNKPGIRMFKAVGEDEIR